jgi:hypothetical protein
MNLKMSQLLGRDLREDERHEAGVSNLKNALLLWIVAIQNCNKSRLRNRYAD